MEPLNVGDRVVRKINHLNQGGWSRFCNGDPRNEYTVARTSFNRGGLQFVRFDGMIGSYYSSNFIKVNDA